MKVKDADASGVVLDWLVAKAEDRLGRQVRDPDYPGMSAVDVEFHKGRMYVYTGLRNYGHYNPSTNWSQGGPIIEREKISVCYFGEYWWASPGDLRNDETLGYCGPTPLIAAMRCYVASKLGDELEVPDELAKE